MDEKTILRSFSLEVKKDEERPDCNVLKMFSGYDGDFGPVSFVIEAELDSQDPILTCHFIQTSAESPYNLFAVRSREVAYFVLKILPLFKPLSLLSNALSFSPQQESSDS